jgi:hypothetical protein
MLQGKWELWLSKQNQPLVISHEENGKCTNKLSDQEIRRTKYPNEKKKKKKELGPDVLSKN